MDAARKALLEQGADESVEVNQRALIDKILARYSGEWTVLREILQNADDAGATSASVHFESASYLERDPSDPTPPSAKLPDLKKHVIARWSVKNNGMPFREQDWARLKKIAEGNPDPEQIGAFGVGFYSVFSVSESPMVTSGATSMLFYWKDNRDQLFVRRGPSVLPPSSSSPEETTFTLDLREPAPLPSPPADIARFLATSLTFMRRLRSVELWVDGWRMVRLTKDVGAPEKVGVPKGVKGGSPGGMMEVEGVESTNVKISADALRCVYTQGTEKPPPRPSASRPTTGATSSTTLSSLFSSFLSKPSPAPSPPPPLPTVAAAPEKVGKDKDPLAHLQSAVSLRIVTASFAVKVSTAYAGEIERATKKPPPGRSGLSLIYTGADDYEDSVRAEPGAPEGCQRIFEDIVCDLEGQGRGVIFIGQKTAQTTGIGGHLAARFIPTVERESVDLVDRHIAVWNRELLGLAGFLARTIYEDELASVNELWKASPPPAAGGDGKADGAKELREWLTKRALHALRFFTFWNSTPNSIVSRVIETAFFESSTTGTLPLISTAGVLPAHKVRLPDHGLRAFLPDLPTLPDEVIAGAGRMVAVLEERKMIRRISLEDMLKELQARPLSEEQMLVCLRWWLDLSKSAGYDASMRTRFLTAVVYNPSSPADASPIQLSGIRTVLDPRRSGIPPDLPLPSHTLPYALSRALNTPGLSAAFAWKELGVDEWVEALVQGAGGKGRKVEEDVEVDAVFAERVLGVVGRAWSSFGAQAQARVKRALEGRDCVPTKSGMKKPGESYFANVSLFSDLPILALPKNTPVKGGLETLLAALGVRKHVDLQLVFERLAGTWTNYELAHYLASVPLSAVERDRLRETAAYHAEGNEDKKPRTRYIAGALYEPNSTLRDLGLPIIDWAGHRWRSGSDEGKLLFSLGLQRHPPVETLLAIAADTADPSRRKSALQYFLDEQQYRSTYAPLRFKDVKFIPALMTVEGKRVQGMGSPTEVYTNPEAGVMGFATVDPDISTTLVPRLGLKSDPPSTELINVLVNDPPADNERARVVFEYLSTRLGGFLTDSLRLLRITRFIPVVRRVQNGEKPDAKASKFEIVTPSEVFFTGDDASTSQFHRKLFRFVDFGMRANAFLRAAGVKSEPTVEEIALMVIKDPQGFLNLAGSPERYLDTLRTMAANTQSLREQTKKQMRSAPILLGSRLVVQNKDGDEKRRPLIADDLDEDEDTLRIFRLCKPSEVVISDDSTLYQTFNKHFATCPEEHVLEAFYESLGAPRLTKIVRQETRYSPPYAPDNQHEELRKLVLGRLTLFMHERAHYGSASKPLVDADALKKPGRFTIHPVRSLTVSRTLSFGGQQHPVQSQVSAAAALDHSRSLVLYVHAQMEMDMYELAATVIKALFAHQRPNDVLLFNTLLTTPLKALKRRGFNVDRILNQERVERQAIEARERERKLQEELNTISILSPAQRAEMEAQLLKMFPGADPAYVSQIIKEQKENHLAQAANKMADSEYPRRPKLTVPGPSQSETRTGGGLFESVKRRFISRPSTPVTEDKPGRSSADIPTGPDENTKVPIARPPQAGPRLPPPGDAITPMRDIRANALRAVAACRPDGNDSITSQAKYTQVKEQEGYCDLSSTTQNLNLVGTIAGLRFYASKDIPDAAQVVAEKGDIIKRMVEKVVAPLGRVFQMNPAALHIFYDLTGPTIAFNRGRSLFINLRFYEAWHDEQVKAGQLGEALISNYHTYAHELAHNVVQQHDSQHEFYMSTISEQYMIPFMRYLATVDPASLGGAVAALS